MWRVGKGAAESIAAQITVVALVSVGCGVTPEPQHAAPRAELEPVSLLVEIARASSVGNLFEPPSEDTGTLEELLANAASAERGERMWDLARARLASLEEAYGSRAELESAIEAAVQEREAAIEGLRQRRAEEERLAREAEEAAERERQRIATEAARRAAEADRRASEDAARRERERQAARDRQDAQAYRHGQREAGAAERERERLDEEFRRRASGGSDAVDRARERERERLDDEFRRRVEAAERRRRRRAGQPDKRAQDIKQSRRSRRRARARRAAARRRRGRSRGRSRGGRRGRRASPPTRAARHDSEWSPDEVDPDLLREGDWEALERHAEHEHEARVRLRLAESTIEEEQRELDQLVRRSRRGVSDEVKQRVEFAWLWGAWRTGHERAAELAEAFTEAHPSAGDLLALAWMIRGEIAAAQRRTDESLAAFRFGMNRIGEPIYAFSLWRSAAVQRAAGDDAGARESLLGAEHEACAGEAPELVRRIAFAAASALDHDVRIDPDGVTRPESCPVPDAREEEEETGWRPEE